MGISKDENHCRNCKHFYITFDKYLPNGCRVFDIKTKQLPMRVVKKESQKDCQGFEKKRK